MDNFFRSSDNRGNFIIGGRDGWATHIHRSNDPMSPWTSIKIESTGERFQRWDSLNDSISPLLPDWMKAK